jgi:outer membrane protein assembly factor BamA
MCCNSLLSQSFGLYIRAADSLPARVVLRTRFAGKEEALQYVRQLPALLGAQGYIGASVDSVFEESDRLQATVFFGEQYQWQDLSIAPSYYPLLYQLGYTQQTFQAQPFDQARLQQLLEQLLDHFENTGYPFAALQLDSIRLDSNRIHAALVIDQGKLYRIDSIALHGTGKISEYLIQRQLDIFKGSLYNREKLNNIDKQLSELPYLEQSEPWTLQMLNAGAILHVYVKQKKSNEINALVGFLPQNQEIGGKLLVTGEALLNLQNAFGTGEQIGLHWQQLQSQSPRLDIAFAKPYILKSRFGMAFNFQLYKKDSSYLNLQAKLAATYRVSPTQSFALSLSTFSTSLLTVDTNTVINTRRLPDVMDLSITNVGLDFLVDRTDYRFNPRKGYSVTLSGTAGRKSLKRNNAIVNLKQAGFDYNSLYDTVQMQTYQVSMRANGSKYFSVGRQSVVRLAAYGGWIYSPYYYRNELFQIGGFKLLRGFDEESIFTNAYAVLSTEFRYLLGRNSYFYAFADGGNAGYRANDLKYNHTYIGTGIGLAFETGSGILNLSYAVGKRDDQKLDLRQSKIHIGFVSLF